MSIVSTYGAYYNLSTYCRHFCLLAVRASSVDKFREGRSAVELRSAGGGFLHALLYYVWE
jgi:hypothetical protein